VEQAAGPLFATLFTLIFLLSYLSALKVEKTCLSETSINFEWTTSRYIPEDNNFRMVNVLHMRITLTNRKQAQDKFKRRVNSGKLVITIIIIIILIIVIKFIG
jgi:hypothetical protein